MQLAGERRVGNLIHSETPIHGTRARFLSRMTVNIQFHSAVTTGMTQNKMFCMSSKEHLGVAHGSTWGHLCPIVKAVNVGASFGQRREHQTLRDSCDFDT